MPGVGGLKGSPLRRGQAEGVLSAGSEAIAGCFWSKGDEGAGLD